MDCNADWNELTASSAIGVCNSYNNSNIGTRGETNNNDLGDHKDLEGFRCQTRRRPSVLSCTRTIGVDRSDRTNMLNKGCKRCETSDVLVCHVNLDSIVKLKNSTKKLLCLLEELQTKTHSNALVTDEPKTLTSILQPLKCAEKNNCDLKSVTDFLGAEAIKRLENQTKDLDSIFIVDEDDDCSVYKRLTRKCHCLNQKQYNDFVIHFNEETKFCTSNIGEIIKNMKILKKFLYIGGNYTKRALMFLNEGLTKASRNEKVEIIQAISFADICNVFDEYTIVAFCILWPNRNEIVIEPMTQELTTTLLYKISQVEEGRRYLNFNSKIIWDIRRVLKKKSSKIDYDILECLKSVLALCQPAADQRISLTYHSRPVEEALANKTLNALNTYRNMMTFSEVFQNLDMLQSYSSSDRGKLELTQYLPLLLSLFKNMLIEYDNSGMNIIITNILNNILTKTALKDPDMGQKSCTVADTGTEPVTMKNVIIQIPAKKNVKRNNLNKSKLTLGAVSRKDNFSTKRKDLHHYQNPAVIVVPLD